MPWPIAGAPLCTYVCPTPSLVLPDVVGVGVPPRYWLRWKFVRRFAGWLAGVEKCEAVCGLVGCRRMHGAWDAWCCYNYPSFKGIVRDPKLSSNSLPLGGPSSSLKIQREKRVTAFAACPEKSLMHYCPLIRLPFAVPVSGVSSYPRFRID